MIDPIRAILPSFIIAAGLALIIRATLSRFAPVNDGAEANGSVPLVRLWAWSLPLGVASFFGVNLLRETFSIPSKYWETLGLIALVAGLLGPLLTRISWRWRLVTWPLAGLAMAWFLVPTWATLDPGRLVYVPILAVYISGVGILYEWGIRKSPPGEFLFSLCATTVGIAAGTAAIASLKYGELASIPFAIFAGFFLLSLFLDASRDELAGMLPCAATLIVGAAFVGYIYPQPPIYELMLLPLAPVGLFAASLKSDEQSGRAIAARVGGFVIALVAMLILLFARNG